MAVIESAMELFDLDDTEALNYHILRCIVDRREPTMQRFADNELVPHGDRVLETFISKNILLTKSDALGATCGNHRAD